LLSLFKPEKVRKVDFFLDFQNFQEPTGEEELEAYNAVREVLNKSDDTLDVLTNYGGCGDAIHKVLSDPTKENETEAWDVLIPAAQNLKDMFEYALELGEVAPRLLSPLCKIVDEEGTLENQTALCKLLCDLFNYILQFDDKKMINPHIQNDLAFYRRSMAKLKTAGKNILTEESANKMCLFYATPTPMMNMLTKIVQETDFGISKEDIVQGLSLLANVCLDMIEKGILEEHNTIIYCLRAMTASIILVDQIAETGVFGRKSPINIKNAILILRDKMDELGTAGLINAIRFTTRHINDPDTPNSIKNLLV